MTLGKLEMSDTAYTQDGNLQESSDVNGASDMVDANRKARPVPRISIQAFCEDQKFVDAMQSASNDRRMDKAHLSMQMGGVSAALETYRDGPTPNLIILESKANREKLLMQLDQLAEVCDAGTKVIIVGHVNDVILYRALVERGVSEYLVAPAEPLQIISSISNLYSDPDAEPLGQILAFVGAKGGVGSSVLSHNVAWALSEITSTDVVISDFDLPFGTAGLDFNQDPSQGIAEALFQSDRLDDVMLDRLLSKCSDRLSLFASAGNLDQEYDVEREPCDLVLDVLRKNIPNSVLDLPHAWTSWSKYVLMQSDEIIITATPDLANLRNTKNILDYLKANRKSDVSPRLILNLVGMPKKPEISVADFSQIVELKPSVVIDYDAEVFGTAANNGQMIGEFSQKSKVANQILDFAYLLANVKPPQQEEKSILKPILSRIGMK